MKRYMWVVPAVALLVAALFMLPHRFAAQGAGGNNGGGSIKSDALPDVTLAKMSNGVVFFTAAINADASVANCWGCDRSHTLQPEGPGTYQVAFYKDVQANYGFARWVQVDTLQEDSILNVSCTTADRAGDPKAVWVECFDNSTGEPKDTSFFLFVSGQGLVLK